VKWFNIYEFPVSSPDKPNYEGWWGLGALPKLMVDNPEVRKYLFDVTEYWTKRGIDGWRLDVPGEMSHDFWIEWRKLVKGINPGAYIVGELWEDASDWLRGDQFDAVMNYRFRGGCVGFFALRNQNAAQFDSVLRAQRSQYPAEVNYALQNLIGSHDTERFLTLSEGDVRKVKLGVLMQMTYPGAPMMYYGDEIGMTGRGDPDCRKTMEWDSLKWNRDLLEWNRKLIAIRKATPVLRHGTFSTLVADSASGFFAFMMSDLKDTVVVAMNNGMYELPVTINVGTTSGVWRDAISGLDFTVANGSLQSLRLQPLSGVVLSRVKERISR
jgi:glycosidase